MKQTCAESLQTAVAKLFDRGFAPADIGKAELDHFRIVAPLGMSRERAAMMLRDAADGLEHQTGSKT